jgi:hypothetical protein
MPVADPIDLLDFIRRQRGERRPTFVVLAPPLSGKTTFAQQLSKQPGFGYLNVLETLAQRSDLAQKINVFDDRDLEQLILDRVTASIHTLLIDDLDFLFPLWDDLSPFKNMVDRLRHPDRAVVFAFFVQSRSAFEDWPLQRADRRSRLLRLDEIQPIG